MLGIAPLGKVVAALGEAVVLSVTPSAGPKSGSTDVIVRGLNFQTGSTVKFGTTTQTGAAFVDATKYTLTTQAGDSNYVDDISVVPTVGATGLLYVGYDRLSSVPSTLDPASKALTGFYPSTYTGSPAVGGASAGSSGTNNMDAGGSGQTPPTTGTAVNGFVPQHYSNSGFVYNATSTTMLGSTSWSYQCLVNMTSLDAGLYGQGYADPAIWTDSLSTIGVTISKTGIRAYQADSGGGYFYTPDIEIPTNTWFLVQARWTGSLLQCRVNCGPWQTIAIPTIFAIGSAISSGFSGYSFLSGDKLYECFQNSSWTNAEADKIAAFTQNKYALTGLGFPVSNVTSIDPATLNETGYFIDYPGTSWTGTASAGTSSGANLTAGAFVAPGVGTLNGHGTATLNGTTQAFQASVATNTVLGATPADAGWTMVYLVKFTSLAVSGGFPYVDSDLFTDPQAVLGIGASSDAGIQIFQIDENDGYANYVTTPNKFDLVPTATWMVVNARWDGQRKIDIRTLDGTVHEWAPFLCRQPCYPTGAGQPYVGANYASAVFAAGEIAAITWSKKVYSSHALDGVTAFLQTRYALTLGVVSDTTGTGTAAVSPLAGSGSGKLTFTGTGNAAVSPLASTGAAKETFSGTGTGAVSPLAGSGVSALTFSGTCSGALSPLAGSGSGSLTFSGTCNAAQSSLASTSSGKETFSGVCASAVSSLAASGSGIETFTGTVGAAVSSLAASIAGLETFTGTGTGVLSSLAGTGAAKETFSGTGGGAVSPLACTGTGTYTPLAITGTGTGACSSLAGACTGTLTFSGSCATAVSSLAAADVGTLTFTGTGSGVCSSLAATGISTETFSGTASGALSPLTSSGAGKETFTGTVNSAASSLGGSSVGSETFSGSGGGALSPLAVTGAGTYTPLAITGTGTGACSPLAGTCTGSLTFSGTCASAASPLGASSPGALTFAGTGTGLCSSLAGIGIAVQTFSGTGTSAASPLAGSGSGKETFTGVANSAVSSLAGSANGSETFTGTANGALSPLAVTGAGLSVVGISGSGSAAISPLAGTGIASETFSGSANSAVSPLAASGTGSIPLTVSGSGSASLSSLGASGTGSQTFTGTGGGAVSRLGCSGSCLLVFSGTGTGAFSPQAVSGFASLQFAGSGSAFVSGLQANVAGQYSEGAVTGSGGAAFSHLQARGYQTQPVSSLMPRIVEGIIVRVSQSGSLAIVQATGSEIIPVVTEGNIE